MVDRDSIGLPIKSYNRRLQEKKGATPEIPSADPEVVSGNVTERKNQGKRAFSKPKVIDDYQSPGKVIAAEYSHELDVKPLLTSGEVVNTREVTDLSCRVRREAPTKATISAGGTNDCLSTDTAADSDDGKMSMVSEPDPIQQSQASTKRSHPENCSANTKQTYETVPDNPFEINDDVKCVKTSSLVNIKPGELDSRSGHKEKLRNILRRVDEASATSHEQLNGRVFGFPNSDGSALSNYYHYVRNNHPLFALVFSHPLHPFSKRNRLVVHFCVLSVAYSLSVALLSNYFFHEASVCDLGCSRRYSNLTQTNECSCITGNNAGLSCSSYDLMCAHFSPALLSAICAVVLVIYGSLLQSISSCGCIQGQEFIALNCITCKSVVELFGGYVLTIFAVLSCFLFLGTFITTYTFVNNWTVTKTFLTSKGISLLYWFLYSAPYFAIRYPYDKEHFMNKQNLHAVNDKVNGDVETV